MIRTAGQSQKDGLLLASSGDPLVQSCTDGSELRRHKNNGSSKHCGSLRMKLKHEFGHYTEVRTAPTKAVEKVRVFVSTGC